MPHSTPSLDEHLRSAAHAAFARVRARLNARIVAQDALIERMLIALLADGHILVEGAPGLAKTSAIKALAECMDGSFHRIQFTPDLLPADLTGSDVFRQNSGRFEFNHGPIFNNLLLADEINRAPAKVQSALLEAMEERQVTVGQQSWPLPDPFLVMATQNPIEQEGTYPLPEAQLDRFMIYTCIDHPGADDEAAILALNRALTENRVNRVSATNDRELNAETVRCSQSAVLGVHMSSTLERYIVDLVVATRAPQKWVPDLDNLVRLGASPRATLALDRGARAMAWLDGRDYVIPQDILQLSTDILSHRLLLSFDAQVNDIQARDIVAALTEAIPVP